MNPTAVEAFEPGTFIEINDTMTGTRKLALVAHGGTSYVDLDVADATPLPIWEALDPKEAGNMLSWGLFFVDQEPSLYSQFSALCKQLMACGEGYITYNRAAYWAFQNKVFDFDQAMSEARRQTQRVEAGRQALDALVNKQALATSH